MDQGRIRKPNITRSIQQARSTIWKRKYPQRERGPATKKRSDRFQVSKYLEHKHPDKWRSRDFIFHTLLVRSVPTDTGSLKIRATAGNGTV